MGNGIIFKQLGGMGGGVNQNIDASSYLQSLTNRFWPAGGGATPTQSNTPTTPRGFPLGVLGMMNPAFLLGAGGMQNRGGVGALSTDAARAAGLSQPPIPASQYLNPAASVAAGRGSPIGPNGIWMRPQNTGGALSMGT